MKTGILLVLTEKTGECEGMERMPLDSFRVYRLWYANVTSNTEFRLCSHF